MATGSGDDIILRQGVDVPATDLQIEKAKTQSDGTILLSWSPITDADNYRISLLGAELIELQTLDAGSKTSIVMSADIPPRAGEP